MFFLESATFLLSTLSILILSYLRITNTVFQQITAALLALTLVLLTYIISFNHSELMNSKKVRLLLLLLSSSLIQFLVISTGGFYSPFLILLHLYILGTSFLLNSRSPISFLILSVATLTANVYINPQMMNLFKSDPGPIILYLISFVGIIPLAQFLMYSYHLKDKLLYTLKEYTKVAQKREKSLLKGLKELVIVTDENFRIISTNEAVLETTGLSENQVLRHPLLEIIPLRKVSGNPVDTKTFFEGNIFSKNVISILSDFYLQTKADNRPRKVFVQIRPIGSSGGQIQQIVFIISDALASSSQDRYTNLELAKQKHSLLISELSQKILGLQQKELLLKIILLGKLEEDLLLSTEIDSQPLEETPQLCDIAYISRQAVEKQQGFAAALGISVIFDLPALDSSEQAMLSLLKTDLPSEQIPVSEFTVPVKKRFFEIIISKLLEMAILLSSDKTNSTVKLTPVLQDNALKLQISFSHSNFTPEEKADLFKEYYGDLGLKTRLQLGSGLEGFIAKTIGSELNLSTDIDYSNETSSVNFSLTIPNIPLSSKA